VRSAGGGPWSCLGKGTKKQFLIEKMSHRQGRETNDPSESVRENREKRRKELAWGVGHSPPTVPMYLKHLFLEWLAVVVEWSLETNFVFSFSESE
jgi:hypothetical protein